MLKSYLAMAVRQLLAQKLYTAINVAGLALGLACALLIALFVRHELSYDRHYALADRIVRISDDVVASDSPLRFAGTAPIVATLLPDYFSEIERAARLSTCFSNGANISVGGLPSFEPHFVAADSELFEIFDFEWLHGDPKTALATPTALVVTESVARRHFGTENPMGRTVAIQAFDTPFEVTGVLRDLPDNTHLKFNLLVSLRVMPPQALESWGNNCYHTYAVLRDGAAVGAVQSRLGQFLEDRFNEGSSSVRGFTAAPITDIHLRSTREGEMRTPGSLTTVYTFAAIAAFVLLIACINFTNLATARAVQRAKEVGVRKVAGSARRQLIVQFVAESLLVAVVGSSLAMTLVGVALPQFGSFLEREIGWRDLASLEIMSLVLLTTLLVGLVAGSYPAFFLSAFKPVRVLRGDVARGSTATAVRKALVVVQFAISIALGIATFVVFEQARFAQAFELGYNKEQVVVLSGTAGRGLGPQWEAMKRLWLELPEVRAVSASNVTPGTRSGVRTMVKAAGADGYGFVTSLMIIERDFLETYEIDLLAGRSFADENDAARAAAMPPAADASPAPRRFVLNELAIERLGWTVEDAPGRLLDVNGPGIVVGVVENVHLESVRDVLVPVAYHVPPVETVEIREASIRVTGRDLERTLADVDAIWRRLGPGTPVVRRFLDEDFEALYRSERRQARLLTLFSALAVVIACLGLYGLASFSTTRRTKEIGIRKTLGASVPGIVKLFVMEFGAYVLLANVIAWPVAYVAMQRWLSGFAYRIELGPFVFVASGLLALAVAVLTVALVATRAARAKPVTTLRYE
ncbi:MAG TPA: ABC transporter permease [Gammaproteobacteria bacterium]|nr:ABC transporter permease [Gammaproteobacteria bacterium]